MLNALAFFLKAMADESDPRVEEIVARQAAEIERLKDAFGLLGVSACSWCKKFLRRTDPGALFDAGELVCYGCIHQWWPTRCVQLSTKERENLVVVQFELCPYSVWLLA